MSKLGYIRVFAHKMDTDFELCPNSPEVFRGGLLGRLTDNHDADFIENLLLNDGALNDCIVQAIDKYKEGEIIEIVGEVHFRSWVDQTDCGPEHDYDAWLESVETIQLNQNQIERFTGFDKAGPHT